MSGIGLAAHSPPTACKRVVSGTISLPSQGFFSPFPHGTGSLSVASEYLALPDGPGRFPQGSTCPAVLRSHLKEDCIFTYGAVTLYGRPFQTVRLTLSYPSFNHVSPDSHPTLRDYCGPATPCSLFKLHGLGYSDFARHYYRNHGCFLFLRVLRWFTSPGSLRHPMYSDNGCQCSHWQGFPIRTSPDHSLLATPRSLSQLTTSFIAYLRQGIHTHALSSLTIKSILNTDVLSLCASAFTCSKCPSIFNCQRTIKSGFRISDVGFRVAFAASPKS